MLELIEFSGILLQGIYFYYSFVNLTIQNIIELSHISSHWHWLRILVLRQLIAVWMKF